MTITNTQLQRQNLQLMNDEAVETQQEQLRFE
jgi:hypothetical protein